MLYAAQCESRSGFIGRQRLRLPNLFVEAGPSLSFRTCLIENFQCKSGRPIWQQRTPKDLHRGTAKDINYKTLFGILFSNCQPKESRPFARSSSLDATVSHKPANCDSQHGTLKVSDLCNGWRFARSLHSIISSELETANSGSSRPVWRAHKSVPKLFPKVGSLLHCYKLPAGKSCRLRARRPNPPKLTRRLAELKTRRRTFKLNLTLSGDLGNQLRTHCQQ